MPRTPKPEPLVRYISPYGSPAWMPRHRAEFYLREDERRYDVEEALGILSKAQREVGWPRIEVVR